MHPLDALARRLATGEIAAAEALRQAREPRLVATLDLAIVTTLTHTAAHLRRQGRWREAIKLLQVLLAAGDADDGGRVPQEAWELATVVWLETISLVLWHAPDPRLYHEARRRGEGLVAAAQARGDRVTQGNALLALGVLHLEPFSRHRSAGDIPQVQREWARRLYEGETWDGERDPTAPEGAFPEPLEALRLAERHLQAAVAAGEGEPRAQAWKALVATLALREELGDPAARAELIRVGQRALADEVVLEDPARVVETLAQLQRQQVEVDFRVLGRVLAVPFEQLQARYGNVDTATLLLNVSLLLETAGAAAHSLRLLQHYQPFLQAHAQGNLRRTWFMRVRTALREALIGDYSAAAEANVKAACDALRQRVDAEGWSLERTGAALLALAERTHQTQEELLGIPLLDQIKSIPPFSEYWIALRALRSLLWWSAASRLAQENPDLALDFYARALGDAVEVDEALTAAALLPEMTQAVARAGAAGLAALMAGVTPVTRRLERLLGEPGTKGLQALAGAASLRLVVEVQDGSVMHDLLRLAKGLRFRAALVCGIARRYEADLPARALLNQIAALGEAAREKESAVAPGGKLSALGELLLVSPQMEGEVRLAGRSPREALANLQHQYEIQLDHALSDLASDDGQPEASAAAGFVIPDEQTVLLEYYLTRVGDAELVVIFLVSSSGAQLHAVQLGAETAPRTLVLDGAVSELGEVAARVLALRRAVNEMPGSGPLSAAAEHCLTQEAQLLLGQLPGLLERLHAEGKRHLCIVPHGPLHAAPLHLLHVQGRPLAEDWLVTYLPNLQLGARREVVLAESAERTQLTAIGLSFTKPNAFGLLSLDNVVDEVQAVARTLSGAVLLDEQATKEAILRALKTSRYVHLATHGAHNPFAAAFQCLYCSPGDGDDGRLFAHELLGHDLRGLELITLSACETALGRFDLGDNLRGLPANLFLAGARTIIGTLWDLETNAAETFFTALYAVIGRGAAKGAAFAEAQRVTRARHPEYRDWGAFYFAGDWR